jgi:hypothetical protein
MPDAVTLFRSCALRVMSEKAHNRLRILFICPLVRGEMLMNSAFLKDYFAVPLVGTMTSITIYYACIGFLSNCFPILFPDPEECLP